MNINDIIIYLDNNNLSKLDSDNAKVALCKMDAITLTYLYFEISKYFKIKFVVEDLSDYRFTNLDSLIEAIHKQMNKK